MTDDEWFEYYEGQKGRMPSLPLAKVRVETRAALLARLSRLVELDDRPFSGKVVNESALWREACPWPTPR